MRRVRVFAWISLAAAMLALTAASALWLGGAPLAARIGTRLAAAHGWRVEFGDIAVSWGDPIRLVMNNLTISRVDTQPDAVEPFRAERADLELDRAALLRLMIRVRRLSLDNPRIILEPQASERTALQDLTSAFEKLRELDLHDGSFEYRNPSTGAETTLKIDEMTAQAPEGEGIAPLIIAGRGEFEGKPFVVNRAELARKLFEGERGSDASPHPVALEGFLGANKIALSGNLRELQKLQGLDVRVDMAGEDLQQVLAALSVPLPRMPIYLLAGRLQHEVGQWQIDGISGWIGDSRIAGSIRVESYGSGPPHIRADLRSDELHLADLRSFVGGESPSARPQASDEKSKAHGGAGRIVPDFEIPMGSFSGFAADVSLDAARVKPPAGWGIEKLTVALSVADGGLRIERLRLGTAGGGELTGEASLHARNGTPELSLRIDAHRLALRPLFARADIGRDLKELGGVLNGSARLRSRGATQRGLLADLQGGIELQLKNARLTRRMARIVESDVGEAFEKMFGDGKGGATHQGDEGRINCIMGRFDVTDGVATATPLLLDTSNTIVLGRGNINLGDETVMLELRPFAKDRSRRPVGIPLYITGNFVAPQITADKAGFAARLGAALGLGAVEVSPEMKALLGTDADAGLCARALSGNNNLPHSRAAPPERNGAEPAR